MRAVRRAVHVTRTLRPACMCVCLQQERTATSVFPYLTTRTHGSISASKARHSMLLHHWDRNVSMHGPCRAVQLVHVGAVHPTRGSAPYVAAVRTAQDQCAP